MAETATEKAACENCGSEARDGTSFCYNCGKALAATGSSTDVHTSNGVAAVSNEAQAALDDLAEKLKIEEPGPDDKLAQAAAERKRARVKARRNEVVWEPSDGGNGLLVLFTLLICLITGVVVFAAVYWK